MNYTSKNELAALAVKSGNGIGFTSLSIKTQTKEAWQQLLPAGYFSAVDGRPYDVQSGKWFLDNFNAQRLISRAQLAVNDLVIDYEHQTLNTEKNGQPAPAAGWFKSDIEWRDGSGLWIRANWTKRAADHIRSGEYRFLSAVFTYDKKTGIPQSLHSAALVNRAGLDGMQAIAALNSINQRFTPAFPILLEEKKVIRKYQLSERDYEHKRNAFCALKGKAWPELINLSDEDKRVLELTGLNGGDFVRSKIEQIAEEVIFST